jgi:hypothetical protein
MRQGLTAGLAAIREEPLRTAHAREPDAERLVVDVVK